MNRQSIVKAWKLWLESPEGFSCSDPESLGNSLSARQYLENRLERAFQAGVKAAERDTAKRKVQTPARGR